MITHRRSYFEVLVLFSISLFVFTWGLSDQEIIRFESRFYLFALEMWRDGLHIFPTIYHEPYPDYPPTMIWLIEFFAALFGHLNKWVAVLPTAIAAAITVTLTYFIGALHHKRWGLYAFFFCLLSLAFFKNARSISLDIFVAMITTACFYLALSADRFGQAWRLPLIYMLLLLGFACRGPIGLVIPAGVLCVYYFLDRRFKKMIQVGVIACIELILCTLALLWLARQVGGEAFMHQVWEMQVFGRIGSNDTPFYYYLPQAISNLALSFPLALLSIGGVIYYVLKKRIEPVTAQYLIKLTGWMLVVLIGLSLVGDKKIRYLLPLVPAAALLSGYILVAPAAQRYFARLRTLLLLLFWMMPGLLLLTVCLLEQQLLMLAPNLSLFAIKLILAVGQLFNLIIGAVGAHRVDNARLAIFGVAVLCMSLLTIKLIEPIDLIVNRAQDFVEQVENKRILAGARLVFYQEELDGLPIKYIVHMHTQEKPEFIGQIEELNAYLEPAYFVTRKEYFDQLSLRSSVKFEVIAHGNIGHVPVVVFARAGLAHSK